MQAIPLPTSLNGNILIFVLGILIIALAGTKMARTADRLADITGLGEAITGTLFLGFTTALPGIAATITTALDALPALAISNAFGGIAVQTVFLAIADISYRRANLEHTSADLSNMLQTAILIFLLVLILLGFNSPNIIIFGIHPISYLLLISAVAGTWIVYKQRKFPMWRPQLTPETIKDIPKEAYNRDNVIKLLVIFLPSALITLGSGIMVAKSAEVIAAQTGLSQSFVGGFFIAIATSIPELVTTIAAVRAGALALAVGDIVGGNFFDALFVVIGDAFYAKGSIFHAPEVSHREHFLLGTCLILNTTLLLGLLIRQHEGPGKIGLESVLMLVFYIASMGMLYFIL